MRLKDLFKRKKRGKTPKKVEPRFKRNGTKSSCYFNGKSEVRYGEPGSRSRRGRRRLAVHRS